MTTPEPNDTARALASTTSYTGRAVLAAVLFCTPITWPIGFYLAGQWRGEAKRMKALAGHDLPGQGCLGFIWWWGVVSLVLWLIFVAVWLFSGNA